MTELCSVVATTPCEADGLEKVANIVCCVIASEQMHDRIAGFPGSTDKTRQSCTQAPSVALSVRHDTQEVSEGLCWRRQQRHCKRGARLSGVWCLARFRHLLSEVGMCRYELVHHDRFRALKLNWFTRCFSALSSCQETGPIFAAIRCMLPILRAQNVFKPLTRGHTNRSRSGITISTGKGS